MSRALAFALFGMMLITASFAAVPSQAAVSPDAAAPSGTDGGTVTYVDEMGARYHLMTEDEMLALRQEVGVWQPGVDYNQVIDGHGTGLPPPTEEQWEEMVGTMKVYEDGSKDAPSDDAPSLPSSYDISSQLYFPKVGNQQQQGSCAAWAATYYCYGYLEAKDNNWTDAKAGTNPSHLMSPAWTFNRVNDGGTAGSWMADNFRVIVEWGVPSLAAMQYNDDDAIGWGNATAFREAPSHRALYYTTDYFVSGNAAITEIKTWLSSDIPVTFALDADQYDDGNLNDNIITAAEYDANPYNHANTFVGFDDSITVGTEHGAFKVVNSWGSSFGNGGYYWLTYDAVKKIATTTYLWLTTVTDRADYTPSLLATWHFNDAPSRTGYIELGIGSHTSPLMTRSAHYDSDPSHDMPSFMCLDISEFRTYYEAGTTSIWVEMVGGGTGTLDSLRAESYDSGYVPGAASTASAQSSGIPKAMPGYATVDFPEYGAVSPSAALDQAAVSFTSSGQAAWVSVNHHSYYGGYAMQSGDVGDSSSSSLQAVVSGASGVSYYCSVSSESGHDYLRFYVDGVLKDSVSGEVQWTYKSFAFTVGAHTLRWDYVRDASKCGRNDTAWVDKVVIIPQDDAYEDNDHPVDAATLTPTGIFTDLVGFDDDWYRFWVDEDDMLSARMDLNAFEGDLDLFLYDTDATSLLDSSATTGGAEEVAMMAESGGYYYLLVRPDAGQFSRYTLTFTYEPGALDYGKNSSVAILSGTGGFASIMPAKSVTAIVGSNITGTITLRSEVTWPDVETVPLVGTDSWGAPSASYFEIDPDLPLGTSDRVASVSITVPSEPGTYYLVFAFRNETSSPYVASATNHLVGSPVWGDGNDIASLSSTQLNESRTDGRTLGNWLRADGMHSTRIPSDALVINVIPPDTTPPVTSSSLSGTSGSGGWFRSSVTVTLTAVDVGGAGVKSTWYRVDGGGWTSYASPFAVGGAGIHIVEYYSQDNLDNTESPGSASVKVDLTAPLTSSSATGTLGGDGWYVSAVQLTLTPLDALSGVLATYYRLDGGIWNYYTTVASISSDGQHLVDYYSVDLAGNSESQRQVQFKVDRTGPISSISLDGPVGNGDWYLGDVAVSIVANDPLSGVSAQSYRLDSDEWLPYAAPFLVTGEGQHQIEFNSTDLAGNAEAAQTVTFQIDSSPPTTTATLNGTMGLGGWYVSTVQVSLGAEDSLSGLQSIQYSLDGGPWLSYSSMLEVSSPGNHTLRYRAFDLAGNQEEMKELQLLVDDSLPESDLVKNGTLGSAGWYVSEVEIVPQGTDLGSGIAAYFYQLDGEGWSSMAGSLLLTEEGHHVVELYAVDAAGNVGPIISRQIMIDLSAPNSTISAEGSHGEEGWFVSVVDVGIQAEDAASGVEATYYSVQGAAWRLYTGAFALDQEGVYELRFYSVDTAGNLESLRSAEVKVELSAPSSHLNLTGTSGEGAWFVSNVTAEFEVSEPMSGVAATFYRLDGAFWEEFLGPLSLSEGVHQLDYYSVDVAGNIESFLSRSILVDTAAPATTSATLGDRGADQWFVSEVIVSLMSSDGVSGLNRTCYRIDDGAWVDFVAEFVLDQEGVHRISYYAIDLAGNIAVEVNLTVKVDLEAPVSAVAFEGELGSGDWYVSQINLILSVEEAVSGLSFTEWRLDGSSWAHYSGPVNVNLTGSHMFEYRSIDLAGNRESLHLVFFLMDLVPPTLRTGDLSKAFTASSVTLTFNATDQDSSVAMIEVSVDGGAPHIISESPYAVELGGLSDGWHELTVVVTDEAGNRMTEDLRFKVDTNPFSPEGPFGPWLLIGLAALAGAAVLLVLPKRGLLARKKK